MPLAPLATLLLLLDAPPSDVPTSVGLPAIVDHTLQQHLCTRLAWILVLKHHHPIMLLIINHLVAATFMHIISLCDDNGIQ